MHHSQKSDDSPEKTYTCPVCGYPGLDTNPYKNMPEITPEFYNLTPPYEPHFGTASYDVCSCCSFEYGNDDSDWFGEQSNASSFQDFLIDWVDNQEARWFEIDKRPPNWILEEQLAKAGIPIPKFKTPLLANKNKKDED